MHYTQGQQVLVRDFEGEKFRRVVWKEDGDLVFVTSERVLKELREGFSRFFAVPVPKADVQPAK